MLLLIFTLSRARTTFIMTKAECSCAVKADSSIFSQEVVWQKPHLFISNKTFPSHQMISILRHVLFISGGLPKRRYLWGTSVRLKWNVSKEPDGIKCRKYYRSWKSVDAKQSKCWELTILGPDVRNDKFTFDYSCLNQRDFVQRLHM